MTITETNPATRNGVDTATLFATLDAVKAAPQAARFQFRARNEWVSGTHNRTTIDDYFGVGEERSHEHTWVFDADHRPCSWATTTAPHPSSSCCTPSRRASPPAWPTSPPPTA
ncbi:MAG: hypothetical protein ACRD07_18100 [Acidimicrobiales bacterium]